MIHLFMALVETYTVPQAATITFAVFCGIVVVMSILWYVGCNYSSRINTWTWKVLGTAAAIMTSWEDDEDNIAMPTEYASWASAQKWRETCIYPEDRRM